MAPEKNIMCASKLYVCILAVFMAASSAALAAPQYPSGAPALESRLLAEQSADARGWIKDEAAREAASHILSEETPRNAARKYGATGSDVSTMAFLILMEASRAADANVSELVSGVQSAAASRQDEREAQATNNLIAGSQQSQLSGGTQTARAADERPTILPIYGSGDSGSSLGAIQPVPVSTMNLQDAMDRQNQIEDLLDMAMKRVTQPG